MTLLKIFEKKFSTTFEKVRKGVAKMHKKGKRRKNKQKFYENCNHQNEKNKEPKREKVEGLNIIG